MKNEGFDYLRTNNPFFIADQENRFFQLEMKFDPRFQITLAGPAPVTAIEVFSRQNAITSIPDGDMVLYNASGTPTTVTLTGSARAQIVRCAEEYLMLQDNPPLANELKNGFPRPLEPTGLQDNFILVKWLAKDGATPYGQRFNSPSDAAKYVVENKEEIFESGIEWYLSSMPWTYSFTDFGSFIEAAEYAYENF